MLRRLAAEVLALAVPPRCAACGGSLVPAAQPLCAQCRRAIPWLAGARCPRCALPSPCAPCPAARLGFTAAWAPVAHDGPARQLVAALKFRGALHVAEVMAAQMAAGAPAALFRSVTLVPVPLHPGRRRARGFDQAERLAAALSARTGRPVARCLRRDGAPTRQLGASARQRRARGRVEVRAVGTVPEEALLVDDVHTTGATLDACARALRRAGARRVGAITYARALRGG